MEAQRGACLAQGHTVSGDRPGHGTKGGSGLLSLLSPVTEEITWAIYREPENDGHRTEVPAGQAWERDTSPPRALPRAGVPGARTWRGTRRKRVRVWALSSQEHRFQKLRPSQGHPGLDRRGPHGWTLSQSQDTDLYVTVPLLEGGHSGVGKSRRTGRTHLLSPYCVQGSVRSPTEAQGGVNPAPNLERLTGQKGTGSRGR